MCEIVVCDQSEVHYRIIQKILKWTSPNWKMMKALQLTLSLSGAQIGATERSDEDFAFDPASLHSLYHPQRVQAAW